MAKNDPLRHLHLAAVLLTRLPLPRLDAAAFKSSAQAVWAYPVVGAVLGGLALLVGQVALWLGLPAMLAAGLALAALMLASGAMHEDGLADVADGFWGAQDRARRLEIMRDSQIGSYGTLALIIVVGLRWGCYAAALVAAPWTVVGAAALSRGMMPWVMARLPHARADGLSKSVGSVAMNTAFLSVLIGAGVALVCGEFAALVAIPAAAMITLAAATLARRKIGGQTGDVLGAVQQVSEVAILLTLIASA